MDTVSLYQYVSISHTVWYTGGWYHKLYCVQLLYKNVSFMLCYYTFTIPVGKHVSCRVMHSQYVRKFAYHAVLCTDTVSGGLYLNLCLVHSHHTRKNVLLCRTFIHSFIYFAFCKSIQGHKQPKGYRTCHTTNATNI